MKRFSIHYLFWLVLFVVIAIAGAVINRINLDINYIFFSVSFVVFLPLLITGLLVWTESNWTPKRRAKYYNQGPLINLRNLGFSNVDNIFFNGIYKGFIINIYYEHSFERVIVYNVFYKPITKDRDEFDRIYKLLDMKDPKFEFDSPGLISVHRKITFKIPEIQSIESDLDEIVCILKEKGIESLCKTNTDKK